MMACSDISSHSLEWLYDELEAEQATEFRAHLDTCSSCRHDVESLQETRSVFASLPVPNAPPGLTARLLHEAAQHHAAHASLWSRWRDALDAALSMLSHPAAYAMATLVVVVGIGGMIYVRGGADIAQPLATQAPTPAAQVPAAEPLVGAASEARTAAGDVADDGIAENVALNEAPPAGVNLPTGEGAGEYPVRVLDDLERKTLRGAAAGPESLGSIGAGFDRKDDALRQKDKRKVAAKKESRASTRRARASSRGVKSMNSSPELLSKSSYADKQQLYAPAPSPARKSSPSSPPPPAEDADEGAAVAADAEAQAMVEREEESRAESKRASADTWAASQLSQIQRAVKKNDCRRAAVLANDLRERAPASYDSALLKPCRAQVEQERIARSKRRAATRSSKASGEAAPADEIKPAQAQ